MKLGEKVVTPDGPGVIIKTTKGASKPKYHLLVEIESDKYWPHWNIYYHIKDIKNVQPA